MTQKHPAIKKSYKPFLQEKNCAAPWPSAKYESCALFFESKLCFTWTTRIAQENELRLVKSSPDTKETFLPNQWINDSHPELYYLKSSLELDWKARASMHAKIVVIDQKTVMISSTNLTKAAQTKNIEAGAIISDPKTAGRLINHLHSLGVAAE